MYAKHFFKMLLGLFLMGAIGITGLALVDYYSKNSMTPSTSTTTPSASETMPVQ